MAEYNLTPPTVTLCACGCGRPTKIPNKTCRRSGRVKGVPRKFCSCHGVRPPRPIPPPKICECGCGGTIPPKDLHRTRTPRFIPGHNLLNAEIQAKAAIGRKGIKKSPEHIAKIAAANRGKKRSPEICAKMSHIAKNRSEQWRKKLAIARSGLNNPNWKGGVTTARLKRTYFHWRDSVRERDNYTCQRCGFSHQFGLHVHHKIAVAVRPDLMLDPENGITLCHSCHVLAERDRRLAEKQAKIHATLVSASASSQ